MSRHVSTVVWHDLIENPLDLPSQSGYGYILTVRYKRGGFNAIWDDIKFNRRLRRWEKEDITTGVTYVIGSPGWDVADIIAWAEELQPYRR